MLGSVVSAQTEGASGVEMGVGNDPGSTEFEVPQTFSNRKNSGGPVQYGGCVRVITTADTLSHKVCPVLPPIVSRNQPPGNMATAEPTPASSPTMAPLPSCLPPYPQIPDPQV